MIDGKKVAAAPPPHRHSSPLRQRRCLVVPKTKGSLEHFQAVRAKWNASPRRPIVLPPPSQPPSVPPTTNAISAAPPLLIKLGGEEVGGLAVTSVAAPPPAPEDVTVEALPATATDVAVTMAVPPTTAWSAATAAGTQDPRWSWPRAVRAAGSEPGDDDDDDDPENDDDLVAHSDESESDDLAYESDDSDATSASARTSDSSNDDNDDDDNRFRLRSSVAGFVPKDSASATALVPNNPWASRLHGIAANEVDAKGGNATALQAQPWGGSFASPASAAALSSNVHPSAVPDRSAEAPPPLTHAVSHPASSLPSAAKLIGSTFANGFGGSGGIGSGTGLPFGGLSIGSTSATTAFGFAGGTPSVPGTANNLGFTAPATGPPSSPAVETAAAAASPASSTFGSTFASGSGGGNCSSTSALSFGGAASGTTSTTAFGFGSGPPTDSRTATSLAFGSKAPEPSPPTKNATLAEGFTRLPNFPPTAATPTSSFGSAIGGGSGGDRSASTFGGLAFASTSTPAFGFRSGQPNLSFGAPAAAKQSPTTPDESIPAGHAKLPPAKPLPAPASSFGSAFAGGSGGDKSALTFDGVASASTPTTPFGIGSGLPTASGTATSLAFAKVPAADEAPAFGSSFTGGNGGNSSSSLSFGGLASGTPLAATSFGFGASTSTGVSSSFGATPFFGGRDGKALLGIDSAAPEFSALRKSRPIGGNFQDDDDDDSRSTDSSSERDATSDDDDQDTESEGTPSTQSDDSVAEEQGSDDNDFSDRKSSVEPTRSWYNVGCLAMSGDVRFQTGTSADNKDGGADTKREVADATTPSIIGYFEGPDLGRADGRHAGQFFNNNDNRPQSLCTVETALGSFAPMPQLSEIEAAEKTEEIPSLVTGVDKSMIGTSHVPDSNTRSDVSDPCDFAVQAASSVGFEQTASQYEPDSVANASSMDTRTSAVVGPLSINIVEYRAAAGTDMRVQSLMLQESCSETSDSTSPKLNTTFETMASTDSHDLVARLHDPTCAALLCWCFKRENHHVVTGPPLAAVLTKHGKDLKAESTQLDEAVASPLPNKGKETLTDAVAALDGIALSESSTPENGVAVETAVFVETCCSENFPLGPAADSFHPWLLHNRAAMYLQMRDDVPMPLRTLASIPTARFHVWGLESFGTLSRSPALVRQATPSRSMGAGNAYVSALDPLHGRFRHYSGIAARLPGPFSQSGPTLTPSG